jgi:hypothetical protein
MRPAFLSASGGDRADACPPSYALPESERVQDDDADRGTMVHTFLELVQTSSRDVVLASTPEAVREICAAIDMRDVPKGEAEIAYVYDVESGEVQKLGRIAHRGYEAALGPPAP